MTVKKGNFTMELHLAPGFRSCSECISSVFAYAPVSFRVLIFELPNGLDEGQRFCYCYELWSTVQNRHSDRQSLDNADDESDLHIVDLYPGCS